jgi:hypothetical protein
MTVGAKTEIHAVFPRLRDLSPGRKTSAIDIRYIKIWYNELVYPSAIEVFGESIIGHWPLSYAHHVWKDRQGGRLLNSRYGLAGNDTHVDGHAMEKFLRAIHRRTQETQEEDVKMLHGVRFLIQRQNEKMENRVNDLFSSPGDPDPGTRLSQAIDTVITNCFRLWKNPKPSDTHVDLAVELSSPSQVWAPYPLLSSHTYFLQCYIGLSSEDAAETTQLKVKGSQNRRYKAHRIAGLANLAGMQYKDDSDNLTQTRELKVYVTGKEYTYSKQSPNRIQQPPISSWLSHNIPITTYFESSQKYLRSASTSGRNALRIECTLPLARARSAVVIPDVSIIDSIARVEHGCLWYVI